MDGVRDMFVKVDGISGRGYILFMALVYGNSLRRCNMPDVGGTSYMPRVVDMRDMFGRDICLCGTKKRRNL